MAKFNDRTFMIPCPVCGKPHHTNMRNKRPWAKVIMGVRITFKRPTPVHPWCRSARRDYKHLTSLARDLILKHFGAGAPIAIREAQSWFKQGIQFLSEYDLLEHLKAERECWLTSATSHSGKVGLHHMHGIDRAGPHLAFLCAKHNMASGIFGDDPDVLEHLKQINMGNGTKPKLPVKTLLD